MKQHTEKFILGTAQFGNHYGINNSKGKPTDNEVFEILNYAAGKKINTLDTADVYGNASKLIGLFHQQSKYRFNINTKFKWNKDLSISEQLQRSLDELKTESIETYFYHSFEDFLNYPASINELTLLKSKNLVKKIGLSIYGNDQFKIAIEQESIDVIQLPFNLLDNISQRGELIKLAAQKGKELQVRSIFLQGLFFKDVETLPQHLYPLKKYLIQLNALRLKTKLTIEQLALLYVLLQKEVKTILIGVDNKQHLHRNLEYVNTELLLQIKDEIDRIHVKEVELLYPNNWK